MKCTEPLSLLTSVAMLAALALTAPAAGATDQERDEPAQEARQQEEGTQERPREKMREQHREQMQEHMEAMEERERHERQRPAQGGNVDVSISVQEASAGELAAQPRMYYGDVVQVSSEIEEVFGNQSFTLDEDRLGAGPDVVVVLPRQARGELPEGERVRVVGHVRPLVVTEFERDYDWFDFDTFETWFDQVGLEAETRMRPVVVASSITTEDGRELLGATGRVRTDVPTDRPRTDRPGMQARMGQPEQWDVNDDDRIAPEEWADAHFSIWDDDNDTLLNESEWNEVTDSEAFAGIDTGEFSDWDLNNDDSIDEDEFGNWIEENAWNEWDQDGDGFLSFDEAGLF